MRQSTPRPGVAHAQFEFVSVGAAQDDAFHRLDFQSVHDDGRAILNRTLHEIEQRGFFEFENGHGAAAFQFVAEVVQQQAQTVRADHELGPLCGLLVRFLIEKPLPESGRYLHVVDFQVHRTKLHGGAPGGMGGFWQRQKYGTTLSKT
ncbi:hypothetical protein [Paraburkholderia tropica]|uniref:hypothetical protein n=1 Tax=Paraburkholderia tropica TaxID=92647 RepID=UPI002AB65914|nr:hypothetical protein [Paraburkholderia tropica]